MPNLKGFGAEDVYTNSSVKERTRHIPKVNYQTQVSNVSSVHPPDSF
jgi:hypothetical protein